MPTSLLRTAAFLAGCALLVSSARAEEQRVRVAHSEALRPLVEQALAPAFQREAGIAIDGRTILAFEDVAPSASGAPTADVVLTTDPDALLHQASAERIPRYLVFASDAIVVAYAERGGFAKELAAGKPWFESLHAEGVLYARPDPEESRLGLRSIIVLQLASEYYGVKHLVAQVLLPTQVMPENVILARLVAGTLDVALLYRSLAVERKIEIAELPIEINLADPGRSGVYAEGKVEIGGRLHHGSPILLAAAPIAGAANASAASRFVEFLETKAAETTIEAHGYVVPPGLPVWHAHGAREAAAAGRAEEHFATAAPRSRPDPSGVAAEAAVRPYIVARAVAREILAELGEEGPRPGEADRVAATPRAAPRDPPDDAAAVLRRHRVDGLGKSSRIPIAGPLGIQTRNVDPTPTSLCRETVPPRRPAIRRTM